MADFNFFLNRQGVRGNKGEQGEQGYSPRITVKTETAAEYVLNVQNEDGSYDTPNLRGNAIENLGGTYVRYNQTTEQMYTGYADTASTTSQGEVTLSTYEDLASGGDEGEVTTSKDVHDFVEAKISEASVNYVDIDDYTQKMGELDSAISDLDDNKLDFEGLTNTLAAGTNITITPNTSTGKITIAGEPVSQAQADWNQTDTDAPDYIKNKPAIPPSITIDDELSSTSTNSVQNRLITNAINLISNEFENYATNKLDNLSNEGEARLHALKAYSDNGEVLTDGKGLSDITKYAHSTFDRSKFTVIGSPNITDDGIASGFSLGDKYRSATNITISATDEIEIISPIFNMSSRTSGSDTVFSIFETNNVDNAVQCRVQTNNLWCLWKDNSGADINRNASQSYSLNKNYQVKATRTGTTYAYYYRIVGETGWTLINSETSSADFYGTYIVQFGGSLNNSANPMANGTLDMKYGSIKINGQEVFSGNRTGIDTIKSDDYRVVGTPTISADGVLQSPTTSSNHITTGFSYDISKDFEYQFSAYITASQSNLGDQYLCLLRTNGAYASLRFNGSFLYCVFKGDDGILYKSYNTSGWYDFIISKKGTTFTWKYKLNTDSGWSTRTAELTDTYTSSSENLYIGRAGNSYMNYAQIDLNSFKFFDDKGNLVYQPCLKIPYTESKTGSKIVNSIYRDRVNDMAEQFGYANYYTLSDTDFTLPQVELYGMIERINGEIGDVESILNSINSGNGGQ